MSVPARVAALTVAFLLVVGLVVFVAFYYVGSATTQLPTIHYAASGGQVSVTLQEDPQNDSATRPDWVTYYTQDPSSKQWVHTTLFSVPANTKVNVTIYGYDGCTPLRNNYFSQVQGVIGNAVAVQQFDKNNKPLGGVKAESVVNSWADCNVGHTFAIPDLGVFVPVASPNANNSVNNLCGSRRARRPPAARTRWRPSASCPRPRPAPTGGSASSRAAAGSSTATAAPCRLSDG